MIIDKSVLALTGINTP